MKLDGFLEHMTFKLGFGLGLQSHDFEKAIPNDLSCLFEHPVVSKFLLMICGYAQKFWGNPPPLSSLLFHPLL